MRVLPDARLQVVTPCKDHHHYTVHDDCRGPECTILLEYDNPLAAVDCEEYGMVDVTVEQVIHAAFAALPEEAPNA